MDNKSRVSDETFDEFLAGQGMLEACEAHAIREMIPVPPMESVQAEGDAKAQMAERQKTRRRQPAG